MSTPALACNKEPLKPVYTYGSWGQEVDEEEHSKNRRFSPVRDVATGRKKPSGLSGAQDPLFEEAPRLVLGSHLEWAVM